MNGRHYFRLHLRCYGGVVAAVVVVDSIEVIL